MSNELITKKMITVKEMLEKHRGAFSQAMSKYTNIDRLIGIAMSAIRQTPELLNCDQISLLSAIKQSAQLGLEPDGVLGQAYLIPYKGQVQFQIGYQGLLQLARRTEELSSIRARVVYQNDRFSYEYGLKEKLEHIPATGDRGALFACYAIAKFKNGDQIFDVLNKEDIEKVKKASQSLKGKGAEYSPWNTWEESMWKKTAIKRLCKQLPQATELQTANAIDDYVDYGIQDIRNVVDEIAMPSAIKTTEYKHSKKAKKTSPIQSTSTETVKKSEEEIFEESIKNYIEILGAIVVENVLNDNFCNSLSDVKDEATKQSILKKLERLVEEKAESK